MSRLLQHHTAPAAHGLSGQAKFTPSSGEDSNAQAMGADGFGDHCIESAA